MKKYSIFFQLIATALAVLVVLALAWLFAFPSYITISVIGVLCAEAVISYLLHRGA